MIKIARFVNFPVGFISKLLIILTRFSVDDCETQSPDLFNDSVKYKYT